jgi:predicted RNA binding protein YcfA (HicA-like mRNA interferase family)
MYVTLKGRTTVMPTHGAEMRTGTVEAIKKQLGLKGEK